MGCCSIKKTRMSNARESTNRSAARPWACTRNPNRRLHHTNNNTSMWPPRTPTRSRNRKPPNTGCCTTTPACCTTTTNPTSPTCSVSSNSTNPAPMKNLTRAAAVLSTRLESMSLSLRSRSHMPLCTRTSRRCSSRRSMRSKGSPGGVPRIRLLRRRYSIRGISSSHSRIRPRGSWRRETGE
jgi:hypothetical protein